LTHILNFLRDDQGQDLIEYTLLLAFVCLSSAALFISAGGSVSGIWSATNRQTRRAHADIKAFMADFRKAFPDLNFWGAADLIAEGDYVVGRWEGGGTHTGPAFNDFLVGSLAAATGRKMRFTGTTVLKLMDGKIVEEIGLDDGVTALQQLGLIKAA